MWCAAVSSWRESRELKARKVSSPDTKQRQVELMALYGRKEAQGTRPQTSVLSPS